MLSVQASALHTLLLVCTQGAAAAGEPQPVDLAGCLRVLAKTFDRRLVDALLQQRLTVLKRQLKPLVRFAACIAGRFNMSFRGFVFQTHSILIRSIIDYSTQCRNDTF